MSGRHQSKMAAAAAAAANGDDDFAECLERGTRRAQTLLDKLQFTEARSLYHEVHEPQFQQIR